MSRRQPPHCFRRPLTAGLLAHRRAPEPQADAPAEVWCFAYDACGRLVFQGVRPAAHAACHAFAFTGRDYDAGPDTNFQYNPARHVDGSVGRWLSDDPALFPAEDTPEG